MNNEKYLKLKYLFVCGPPRSGTTALAQLLNHDDRILVGIERFKLIPSRITRKHFMEDSFFKPKSEETNFLDYGRYYRAHHEKYKAGKLIYMGDKVPRYAYNLAHIAKTFPRCKILYLYRNVFDVASSFDVRAANQNDSWPKENDYRQALKHWHRGLQGLIEFAERYPYNEIFIVNYERFFSGQIAQLNMLYEYLGLEMTNTVLDAYGDATSGWDIRKAKSLEVDPDKRAWLEENIDQQLVCACANLMPIVMQ